MRKFRSKIRLEIASVASDQLTSNVVTNLQAQIDALGTRVSDCVKYSDAATSAEVSAGTATNKFVTPSTFKFRLDEMKMNNRSWKTLATFSPRADSATVTCDDDFYNYDMIVIRAYGLYTISGSSGSGNYMRNFFPVSFGATSATNSTFYISGSTGAADTTAYMGTYSSAIALIKPYFVSPYLRALAVSYEQGANTVAVFWIGDFREWNIASSPRSLTVSGKGRTISGGSITVFGITF